MCSFSAHSNGAAIVPQAVGDRRVKARLEGGHQRNFGQLLGQQPHRLDVGRIVGRGDQAHLFHRGQHIGRHSLHAADPPAVHRLEADGRHFAGVLQAACSPGQ